MADLKDIGARIAALLETMGGRVIDGAAGGGPAASLTVDLDGRHIAVLIYDATEVTSPAAPDTSVVAPAAAPTDAPAGGVPQQDLVYDVSQFSGAAKPPGTT